MYIRFRCLTCEQTVTVPVRGEALVCPTCGTTIQYDAGGCAEGRVERCLVCPSRELFVRKDFPQSLGLTIIVIGFVLSSVALYFHHSVLSLTILLLTAGVDAVLYLVMGNVLTCYRCHAEYRDVANMEAHGPFELEIHERYRQEAARLADVEQHAPDSTAPSSHG